MVRWKAPTCMSAWELVEKGPQACQDSPIPTNGERGIASSTTSFSRTANSARVVCRCSVICYPTLPVQSQLVGCVHYQVQNLGTPTARPMFKAQKLRGKRLGVLQWYPIALLTLRLLYDLGLQWWYTLVMMCIQLDSVSKENKQNDEFLSWSTLSPWALSRELSGGKARWALTLLEDPI